MHLKDIVSVLALCCSISVESFSQSAPQWDWARTTGNTSFANSICTDANGFVYMTGAFNDSITFGQYTLHTQTLSTSANIFHQTDIYVVKYDSLGQVVWARAAGGLGYDNTVSIQTGPRGDIVVAGYVCDSLAQFGSIQLNTGSPAGQNVRNMFIARYDQFGNVLWAACATGTVDNMPSALCVDKLGNVYVTGNFVGTMTFGNTTLNPGNGHIFLFKLDFNGQALWGLSAGGNVNDLGKDVAVTDSGYVYLAGNFHSALSFPGTQTVNASGADLFLGKFTPAGSPLWLKKVGGTSNDWVSAIGADMDGNVFLTGSFTSPSISFGSSTLFSKSTGDIFVAKLDASGQYLWASTYGGGCSQEVADLAMDEVGDIYITGSYMNALLTFGAFTFTHDPGPVGTKMFVVKIKNSGTVSWARNAESYNENDQAQSVCVDLLGNVYASGSYYSTWMVFDNDSIFTKAGGAGGPDIYLARIDNNAVEYPVVVPTTTEPIPTESNGVIVFPNPSTQLFNVTITGGQVDRMQVIDAYGNIIWESGNQSEGHIPIDLSDVSAGAYVLMVQCKGTISTRKLLLR